MSKSHSLAMFEFSVLTVVGLLTSRGEILFWLLLIVFYAFT